MVVGGSVKAWGIVDFDLDWNGLLYVVIRMSIGLLMILFEVGIAVV